MTKDTNIDEMVENSDQFIPTHVEQKVIYKQPEPLEHPETEDVLQDNVKTTLTPRRKKTMNHDRYDFESQIGEISPTLLKKSLIGYKSTQVIKMIEESRNLANYLHDKNQDLKLENEKLIEENKQLKEIREHTLNMGVTEDTLTSVNQIDISAQKLEESENKLISKDLELESEKALNNDLKLELSDLKDQLKAKELEFDKLKTDSNLLQQQLEDAKTNHVSYETIGEVYTTAQQTAQQKISDAKQEAYEIKQAAEEHAANVKLNADDYKRKSELNASEKSEEIISEAKDVAKSIIESTTAEVTEMLDETKRVRETLIHAHENMVKSARANQTELLNNLKKQKDILQLQVENVVDPSWHKIFVESQSKLDNANVTVNAWQKRAQSVLNSHAQKIDNI